MLFDDLAANEIANFFELELDLTFASGRFAPAIPVEQATGTDPPAESERNVRTRIEIAHQRRIAGATAESANRELCAQRGNQWPVNRTAANRARNLNSRGRFIELRPRGESTADERADFIICSQQSKRRQITIHRR